VSQLKQFVPQEVCLKCLGCCRFSELNSAWLPCLLEEEIQGLVDRKGIPAATISLEKKIVPIVREGKEGFFCPFLGTEDNKCRIYNLRPFECQLYPFLINLRDKKIILTVDLNCPYISEKINSPEFKSYVQYLNEFLNAPAQIKILKDNPQVLQAYEEVAEIIEIKLPDERRPHS